MITFRSPWVPFLVAMIVFARAVQGTFHLDDYALLVDPAITSPDGWLDCFRLMQTRPLTWLTFWANYQMFGEWAGGYLAVNVLLHAVNAALVRIAMGRVVPVDVAVGAAILFAVHPYAVEPVNSIFARAILLATLFSLLAMWAWFDGKFWLAMGWFTVGMLAKEECASLPLFFLMYEVSAFARKDRVRPKFVIAAMVSVACLFGVRTIAATKLIAGAGSGFGAGVTPLQYLWTQGRAIGEYALKVPLPFGLTIDPDIGPTGWIWWIAIAVGVFVASFWFRKLQPGFWILAGLVLLLPSSSVLPAADLMAFRRMYLPMVAVSVGLASIQFRTWQRWVVLFYFAALSFWLTGFWHSEMSLWTRAIGESGRVRPRVQLARVLPPVDALRLLVETQKITPDDGTVASEKARVYLTMQQPALALAEFGRALALAPNDPLALANRGSALAMLGQKEAAKLDFEHALRLDPCQFDARYNMEKVLRYPAMNSPAGCRWNQVQKRKLGMIQ